MCSVRKKKDARTVVLQLLLAPEEQHDIVHKAAASA